MSNDNMRIYNAARSVPKEAQKQFNNGRFSGTDVNPMWRIKQLTELFGPAGLGWYVEVLDKHTETYGDTVMAFVDIHLYIRQDGEWSKPIYGTGGNQLVAKGKPSDEGYKMAYTDALSVACKALGIGADVYFEKDATKYTAQQKGTQKPTEASAALISEGQIRYIHSVCTQEQVEAIKTKNNLASLKDMTRDKASRVIDALQRREQQSATV